MEISAVQFKSQVSNTKLLVPCALSCVLVVRHQLVLIPPSGKKQKTNFLAHKQARQPQSASGPITAAHRLRAQRRRAATSMDEDLSERRISADTVTPSPRRRRTELRAAPNGTIHPRASIPGISPSDDGFSSARIRVYRCSRRAAETLHPTSEAPSPAVVSGRVPRRVPPHSGSSTHSLLDGLPATGWKISALQTVEGAVASGGTRVGRLSAGFIKSHVPDGLHQEDDVHTTNSRSPHVSFNIYTQSADW
ncbi:unnamed protein product [Pleuronectes platessa]|uniref:Uncharacterized protein n=1 Tax=Pleuronectes platessa TaxID=8262 RepID=A0A9N7TVC6_PLEPL|nr:unnamed protein product [Pleuronectes platessa]